MENLEYGKSYVEENLYYHNDGVVCNKGKQYKGNKPVVVELFCGCGGTSCGFEMAGYEIILGLDIHAPSINTFKANHPNATTILGDIKSVSPEDIKKLIGYKGVDVLIGGIPCQGFSLNNKKRQPDDNRNFLYMEFLRFAQVLQPEIIVMENVSGIISTKNGEFIDNIEKGIAGCGNYSVSSSMLNAADYGVPQKRQRLVFVGVKGREKFDFNTIKKTHDGTTKSPYITVKEAIGDLPGLKAGKRANTYRSEPLCEYQRIMRANAPSKLRNHQAPHHPQETIDKIAATVPGQPMYPKFKQRIRLAWDIQSPTQVSGGIRPQFQFGHPEDARGLTIRERCRLQSFPDNFIVKGGIVQGRVQTGNAVPPLLAKALAEALKKHLERGPHSMYRVWYSTRSLANYIIDNTALRYVNPIKNKMYESDANNPKNFHSMPDHIRKILYLDAPDIIVEVDSEPIFAIEVSTEAGTGHNVFQRFARIAASVENNVPMFYVYPEAVIITRQKASPRWDKINPLIFNTLESVMSIYNIPALLYYFPSDFRNFADPSTAPSIREKGLLFDANRRYAGAPDSKHPEMLEMFKAIDEVIYSVQKHGIIEGKNKLISNLVIRNKRNYMQGEFITKSGGKTIEEMSPVSSTVTVPTEYLMNYLSKHENASYKIGELLRSRPETIIYKVDANFRGDPYPGALAAIDYLKCREGKSFEERRHNLVLLWGKLNIDHVNKTLVIANKKKTTIHDFIKAVKASETKNLLTKEYNELSSDEISRYYMQVRYGSTYSKVKHIRVYSYFADATLFPDGSLWRDG